MTLHLYTEIAVNLGANVTVLSDINARRAVKASDQAMVSSDESPSQNSLWVQDWHGVFVFAGDDTDQLRGDHVVESLDLGKMREVVKSRS